MTSVVMNGYVIRAIQYTNNISGTETMEIGSNVESTVNYNDETSECVCLFTLTVKNIGDQEFLKIVLTLEASFSFSPSESKKQIHIQINENLFAQAQATVCAMCGVAGLPPMMVPPVIFTEDNTVEITNNNQ